MKLLFLPFLMALIAVAQVFGEDAEPKEGADYWTSSNQIQVATHAAHLLQYRTALQAEEGF